MALLPTARLAEGVFLLLVDGQQGVVECARVPHQGQLLRGVLSAQPVHFLDLTALLRHYHHHRQGADALAVAQAIGLFLLA